MKYFIGWLCLLTPIAVYVGGAVYNATQGDYLLVAVGCGVALAILFVVGLLIIDNYF